MKLTRDASLLLSNYLQAQPGEVGVITDESFLRQIIEVSESCDNSSLLRTFTLSSAEKLFEKPVGQWLVVSSSNEEALVAEFEARAASLGHYPLKIVSFIEDVLTPYMSKDWPAAPVVHRDARIFDLPSYAVVCTPRSGSTYLGELLSSIGLGCPNEHLRDKEIELLAGLDLSESETRQFLKAFFWRNQRSFVFGTKLISHYVTKLISTISLDNSLIAELRENFKIVYLVRKDKVRQAISDYLANLSGVWHVRSEGGAKALDQSFRKIDYDFAEIFRRYNELIQVEGKLYSLFKDCKHTIIYYEDLVADRDQSFKKVVEFLGFFAFEKPVAMVMRPDSDVADAMAKQFTADYLKVFGRSLDEYVVAEAPVEAQEKNRPAPQSLADLKNLTFGQYQRRSWQVVDYKCRWSPEVEEYIRSDQLQPKDGEPFILALGAAQTFAPYVKQGFLNIISEKLSIPCINFGIGGAGPDFFFRPSIWPRIVELANRAHAVIYQVQSCRTMGSPILPKGKDPKDSLVLSGPSGPIQYDAERAITELRRRGRDPDLVKHLDFVRSDWIRLITRFATEVTPPKILFWFGERSPDYTEDWGRSPDISGIFGGFPQLVNRHMIDCVVDSFDGYVEEVFHGPHERLFNRFTGRPTLGLFGGTLRKDQSWLPADNYYPNSETHETAATKLIAALSALGDRKRA